jgi:hypothetical protein
MDTRQDYNDRSARFLQLRPAIRIILVIQAICMLMGTYTHVNWVVRHGFLYPDVPIYSRIFWDSLTFLDPLAALLLFLRPRKGVLLVTAIICVDVLHNALTGGFGLNPFFLLQVLFCLFVLATLPVNLREIRSAARSAMPPPAS